MAKCKYCGKRALLITKRLTFCDEECLNNWADEFLADNWRDYAYMMGVRIVD